jgi:hypothetical protein
MNDAHAFDLCRRAVDSGSITSVAQEIGYSRTAISLYLSGKYGADVEKIKSAILERYDSYNCIHTGQITSGLACRSRYTAPRPFGGRSKEKHWLVCQSCQYNKGGKL